MPFLRKLVSVVFSVREIAEHILSYDPCDIVKYKILTTYTDFNVKSDEIDILRRRINQSKWVQSIRNEQHSNGSWGRFHTQNSQSKQKYKTTQSALLYLYALGLKRGDEVVDKACVYMESLLDDLSLWPDAWEGNKWYKPAVPLFITSQLAMFGSENRNYLSVCSTWRSILQYSFEDGLYNSEKTDKISEEIIGVNIHNKYIGLNSFNNIILYAH